MTTDAKPKRRETAAEQERGNCQVCGKFQRWADMGWMDTPQGRLDVVCSKCARKIAESAPPVPVSS